MFVQIEGALVLFIRFSNLNFIYVNTHIRRKKKLILKNFLTNTKFMIPIILLCWSFLFLFLFFGV